MRQDQVGQGESGKQGNSSTTPSTPFEQILAMFSVMGGTAQSNATAVTQQPVKVNTKQEETNQKDFTIHNWGDLEAILANWITGLQQIQTTIEQSSTNNQTPATIENQIKQLNVEGMEKLGQWFQSIQSNEKPSFSIPSGELLNRLAELLDQSKNLLKGSVDQQAPSLKVVETLPENQGKQMDLQRGILDKLQTLIDLESQIGSKIDMKPTQILDKIKTVIELDSQVEQKTVAKPAPILDKNLVQMMPTIAVSNTTQPQIGNKVQSNGVASVGKNQPNLLIPPPDLAINPMLGNTRNEGVLPPLPSSVPVTQVVPEVSQWISNQIRFSDHPQGVTEAKFSLYPEHLGQVDIKIISNQGQIMAEIITNTLAGKEAIDGQLQHLRHALQQHGLIVEKLDVSYEVPKTGDASSSGFTFSDGSSNPSRNQQQSSSSRRQGGEGGDSTILEVEPENLMKGYGQPSLRSASSQIDFSA